MSAVVLLYYNNLPQVPPLVCSSNGTKTKTFLSGCHFGNTTLRSASMQNSGLILGFFEGMMYVGMEVFVGVLESMLEL